MDELTLNDLILIVKRRRKYALAVGGVVFAIALVFAARWSNYRSSATVQIEQSDISASLAAPAGQSLSDAADALADQRISQVDQTVTSAASLGAIIEKFNLYPSARQGTPLDTLAEKMSKKIHLDFIGSTLSNPAEAQKASVEQLSAIAFTLSFDYSDAKLTQAVTNELVRRFLEEDLAIRQRQAEGTSSFLGAQLSELEATMAEQEKKIADFRAQHGESGPAELTFNQQALSSTEMSLETIQSQISANEGTQGSLRAQLATIDPYSRVIADGQVLTTPAIQLKALQSKYAALSSRYGPDHPDVVKARHEIEALQAEQGVGGQSAGDTAGLQSQIADIQTNLAAAKATGGPDNPNVIALQHQLKKLQDRLAGAQAANGNTVPGGESKRDADNPAYLQVVSQLKATEEQNKSLLEQQAALRQRLEKYQQAIAQNPAIEEQMEGLTRDYENEQVRYRDLKEKKMAADMSEQLETGRQGQKLVVSSPANLPTKTHPSRLMLMAGGLVLAIGAGFATVVVVEATSQNLYGPHQLANLTGAAPLVTIPYIHTRFEIERARKRRPYIIAGIILVLILGAIAFPYVVMPYDAFFGTIIAKLSVS